MGLFSIFFKPSYHALCEKGIKAFNDNNFDEAIDLFIHAIELDQNQPRAFGWLGLVYSDVAGNYSIQNDTGRGKEYAELAIIAFNKAIEFETGPNSKANDYWQKARALAILGRMDEHDIAIQEADKIVPGFSKKRLQDNKNLLEEAFKAQANQSQSSGK